MTKLIIIKGRLAKQIYDQILSKNKGMSIKNVGNEKNPVLNIGMWEKWRKKQFLNHQQRKACPASYLQGAGQLDTDGERSCGLLLIFKQSNDCGYLFVLQSVQFIAESQQHSTPAVNELETVFIHAGEDANVVPKPDGKKWFFVASEFYCMCSKQFLHCTACYHQIQFL